MKKVFVVFFVFIISVFANNLEIGFDKNTHPRLQRKEGKLAMKVLTNEILKKWIKRSKFSGFETKIYQKTKDLVRDYRSGKISVGVMSSRDFSKYSEKLLEKTRQVVVIKYSDKEYYKLGYVVPKSRSNNALSYWQKKRVAFSENCLVSDFTDSYLLKNYKKNKDIFFSSQKTLKTDGLAIMDLFFGKIDIVFATKVAYEASVDLNPQLKKKLVFKPLGEFLDIPILIFFNNSVEKMDVAFIEDTIKEIFESPRGEQIKSLLHVEKIAKVTNEKLQEIIKFYKKMNNIREK